MTRRKAREVGNADESRPARGDHCGRRGPLNKLLNSLRACASSIKAPAAADDASHARRRSPVSAASILVFAAVSARCAALRNSACAERNSSGGTIVRQRFRRLCGAALDGRECERGRAGERLDVVEQRLQPLEALRAARSSDCRRPEIGLPERPSVVRQTQRPGRIKVRFERSQHPADGVGPLASQRAVAGLDFAPQALHPAHVGRVGARFGRRENTRGEQADTGDRCRARPPWSFAGRVASRRANRSAADRHRVRSRRAPPRAAKAAPPTIPKAARPPGPARPFPSASGAAAAARGGPASPTAPRTRESNWTPPASARSSATISSSMPSIGSISASR